MLRYLLPAAVLATSVAAETCPTATDLDTGITFVLADGEREEHRRTEAGLVEITLSDAEGTYARVLTAAGVYELIYQGLEDGQPAPDDRETSAFPVRGSQLPLPVPGDTTQFQTMLLGSWGTDTEVVSTRVGDVPARIRVGDCTMEVFEVIQDVASGDFTETLTITWFPNLGTGPLTAWATSDGEGGTYPIEGFRW
ncbi:MAG: hypothetical protein ACU0DW_07175 [Shimia sp.]